jgi:hypothetical protein
MTMLTPSKRSFREVAEDITGDFAILEPAEHSDLYPQEKRCKESHCLVEIASETSATHAIEHANVLNDASANVEPLQGIGEEDWETLVSHPRPKSPDQVIAQPLL